MCPLRTSFLVKCPLKYFAHFKSCFLPLVGFKKSFYSVDLRPLSDVQCVNIFFQSVTLFLILLTESFREAIFNLIMSNTIFFPLKERASDVASKT